MSVLTPMQRQYYSIKKANKNSILLFRLGDFYEMFDEDALIASQILGITLTARNKGKENEMKMCGIPYHASENYINKLTQAGKKVAICEQVSDPTEPGIVKREVTKIITPGTVLSENVLDAKSSNFIAAVFEKNNTFGLAFADISTGKFFTTEFANFAEIKYEIQRINPAELLLEKNISSLEDFKKISSNISFWFIPQQPETFLKNFFKVSHLKVFYLEKSPLAVAATAMLLDYINDTQKGQIAQIKTIKKYTNNDYMNLDIATIRNLEVFQTMHNSTYHGSLLKVIDKTVTAAGGRKLKYLLLNPLKNIEKIQQRLAKVEMLTKNNEMRADLRNILKETRDLERLLSKIASSNANPKDLIALSETLSKIPEIKKILKKISENKI